MANQQKITRIENFSEYFVYDTTRESGLRRLKLVNNCSKGDLAGTKSNKGYFFVKAFGKKYAVNRIIYKLFNPDFDVYNMDLEIDHINGSRCDNRIENLRAVTSKQNSRNVQRTVVRVCDEVGILPTGVTRRDRQLLNWVHVFYIAHWRDQAGKDHQKAFSTKEYGVEGAFKLAVEKRNYEFSLLEDYSERHGIRLSL